jgi:hypothetical protein
MLIRFRRPRHERVNDDKPCGITVFRDGQTHTSRSVGQLPGFRPTYDSGYLSGDHR